MKLNINAKELLALYNVLYERFDAERTTRSVEDSSDDVQLRQVYNRLKACLVSALTNKGTDPLDAFLQREQQKIDDLTRENDGLKEAAKELTPKQPPVILSADDDEGPDREYPRKGPPSPQMPRPGKHRGRR